MAAIWGTRSDSFLTSASSSLSGSSGIPWGCTVRRTGENATAPNTVVQRLDGVSLANAALAASVSRVTMFLGEGHTGFRGPGAEPQSPDHSAIGQRGRHFGQPFGVLPVDPLGELGAQLIGQCFGLIVGCSRLRGTHNRAEVTQVDIVDAGKRGFNPVPPLCGPHPGKQLAGHGQKVVDRL